MALPAPVAEHLILARASGRIKVLKSTVAVRAADGDNAFMAGGKHLHLVRAGVCGCCEEED